MEVFGDYELLAPLATGGMAELFRARQRITGAPVVVKRLKPEMEGREDVVDLFLTEADVGQLLDHENVVHVLDAGDVDGRYFIVMELVDGIDAERLLAHAYRMRRPVPMGVAVRIAVEALRGLHAAHELTSPQGTRFGLVHRDVSPDNLFLTSQGLTKVADFGIAKLSTFEGQTQTGLIKGKLAYMAPEQVRGQPLDARADAYALGLVLYEMLSSSRPFAPKEGESELATMMRVRKGSVLPLRKLEPEVPRPVAKALDKALKGWRFLRHKNCAAFADALEDAARANGVWGSRDDVARAVAEVRAHGGGPPPPPRGH